MTTVHTALLNRRNELRNRISAVHGDIGSGLDKDYEEQSVQLENLEVLREIVRAAEQELCDIERQIAELEKRDTHTTAL